MNTFFQRHDVLAVSDVVVLWFREGVINRTFPGSSPPSLDVGVRILKNMLIFHDQAFNIVCAINRLELPLKTAHSLGEDSVGPGSGRNVMLQ